jgi:hypothetical protein
LPHFSICHQIMLYLYRVAVRGHQFGIRCVADWPDTRADLDMVAKTMIPIRVTNKTPVVVPAVSSLVVLSHP